MMPSCGVRDDVVMRLTQSVTRSLDALAPDERDEGARTLALYYAASIDDDPTQLDALGPKLLAALDALGMTPRARAAATKGATSVGTNPLDQLRERRTRRDRAEAMDSPAS
jgi:hypothetical protein